MAGGSRPSRAPEINAEHVHQYRESKARQRGAATRKQAKALPSALSNFPKVDAFCRKRSGTGRDVCGSRRFSAGRIITQTNRPVRAPMLGNVDTAGRKKSPYLASIGKSLSSSAGVILGAADIALGRCCSATIAPMASSSMEVGSEPACPRPS